MTERVIQKLEVDFGPPEGTYRMTLWPEGDYSVGGKPCPSEGQADFVIRYVMPAMNKLCNMSMDELIDFIKEG
jgi:hypothetical protein